MHALSERSSKGAVIEISGDCLESSDEAPCRHTIHRLTAVRVRIVNFKGR